MKLSISSNSVSCVSRCFSLSVMVLSNTYIYIAVLICMCYIYLHISFHLPFSLSLSQPVVSLFSSSIKIPFPKIVFY
jgi:hypothetical protein